MQHQLSKKIYLAIKNITKNKISNLHEPFFDKNEISFLSKCIKSTFVSTVGPQVKEFEKVISLFTKAKYVIATVNGTSALHIILKIIGANKYSEILLPTLNFIASANAIKYCQATPHFIDSEETSLGINYKKLENYLTKNTIIRKKKCYNKKTNKQILALVMVHIFGFAGDIPKIKKLCNKFHIILIEDAAEAVGSYYKNKHLGTWGKAGMISFNGNKTITTGGGGAILTNDPSIAKKALHLTMVGKITHKWKLDFSEVGYNYRLPNINAALGLAQFKKLKKILYAKKKIFNRYKSEFKKIKDIKLLEPVKNCKSNYWLNTIILKQNSFSTRNYILNYLNKNGIGARPCWKLLHRVKYLSKYPKMNLSQSENLEKNIINIPSSPKYGMNS